MSKRFLKIKSYFDNGFWNEERVANAVLKGRITAEEFKAITGVVYDI